jgi:hypothetical protein
VPNFGNFSPSGAKAIIFGKKCWVLLLPIIDPVSGQQVNKLFLWNGTKLWWSTPQDVTITIIQAQEINSVLTAWGTDGIGIFTLFAQPSIAFTKTFRTKLWDKPGGYQFTKFVTRLWGIVQYYSNLSPALNIALDNENSSNASAATVSPVGVEWVNNTGQIVSWVNNLGATVQWLANGVTYSVFAPDAVAQSGVLTGFTGTTNAADMAIVSIMIQDTIAGNRG